MKRNNRIRIVVGVVANIIWLPALIIHEISHLIVILLLFRLPKGLILKFRLKQPNYGEILLYEKDANNKLVYSLIALGPLFELVAVIIAAQFSSFFYYIMIYQLLTINYSFPSTHDLNIVLRSLNSCRRFSDSFFTDKILKHLFPNYYIEE